MKKTILIILTIFSSCLAQIPAPAPQKAILLENAVIHTLTGSGVQNSHILFENGKIIQVGPDISPGGEPERIDLAGRHVYPAMIECASILGLVEIRSVQAMNDFSEMGSLNPNVRAETAVNGQSSYFAVSRANGIALAVSTPYGDLVAGQSALLRMDGWNWQDMTKKAPVSLLINWPWMYVAATKDAEKDKKSQEKINRQIEKIDSLFQAAAAYQTARNQNSGRFHKYDPRLESLIPVLERQLPVWICAETLLQIESAVAWAGSYNLSVVIVGGFQADLAADLLKRENIPVIVTSVLNMPYRRDSNFDECFGLPGRLFQAGVKFCISNFSSSDARNLPYVAAKAAAYGLPPQEALKAVTLYPAQILGIDDLVGTLEPGKEATFMITTGDPLEITTQITDLYIEGRRIDLDNRHKQLYRKYQQRYRQMGD